MILRLSLVASLLLIKSLADSRTVHSRRKRFVDLSHYWGSEALGDQEEYAVPERIVKFVRQD